MPLPLPSREGAFNSGPPTGDGGHGPPYQKQAASSQEPLSNGWSAGHETAECPHDLRMAGRKLE